MSLIGTFETCGDVRVESAFGVNAEVAILGREDRFWTQNGHGV
jgi:hypothetical protein